MHRTLRWFALLMLPAIWGSMALLGGCASERPVAAPATMNPEEARVFIERSIPRGTEDRGGWAADISAAFGALSIPNSRDNACAVLAVIAQESGFHVDPVIPGLGAIAWHEIDARASHAGIPKLLVHGVLQLKSANGRSYAERIDAARTEHELSDVYEDFIGRVPLGRGLFNAHNPIRTRGPMQVQVTFATRFAETTPYPYPLAHSVDEELFTRRGGIYFGVAHLLAYAAPYDQYLYRFADFNAGRYASRNAAFQRVLALISGKSLAADGALLPRDTDSPPGDTELAARSLGARLGLSDGAIHASLEKFKIREFEDSALYLRVYALGETIARRQLPRAVVPIITLRGPKITRKLTTEWYAQRVNGRFKSCLEH